LRAPWTEDLNHLRRVRKRIGQEKSGRENSRGAAGKMVKKVAHQILGIERVVAANWPKKRIRGTTTQPNVQRRKEKLDWKRGRGGHWIRKVTSGFKWEKTQVKRKNWTQMGAGRGPRKGEERAMKRGKFFTFLAGDEVVHLRREVSGTKKPC